MIVSLELQPCCGERTGVGVYTYQLTKNLKNSNKIKYMGNIFNFMGKNDNLESLKGIDFDINEIKIIPYGIYRRIWNKIPMGYNDIFKQNSDITHFFNFIVPPRIKGKVITTIHDMTYIRFPEMVQQKNLDRIRRDISYSLERSDFIITASEFSKNEISELLCIPKNKIGVIPCAVEGIREIYTRDYIKKKFNINRAYFLYCGTIEPRKNIQRIVQAYNLFRDETGLDIKLVLAGSRGWNVEGIEKEVCSSKYCDDIIKTGYISEFEKGTLYTFAVALLFLSVYEGFGIPPLEAMCYGTPVIASNIASIPEVVGDGGLLVDPYNINEITKAMIRINDDILLRNNLVQGGYKQLKKFSWEESANKLQDIYTTLL